jgi:hypothetical protein
MRFVLFWWLVHISLAQKPNVSRSDIWSGTKWGYWTSMINGDGDKVPLMELLGTAAGQATLDQNLQDMSSHGGTVWRMFVEIYDVLDSPNAVNASKIAQLDLALKIAKKRNIRVLVSGALTFWVKRAPAWILNATDAETTAANLLFWSSLAKVWCARSEVLAFDMQNEPGWSFDDTQGRCLGWDSPGACFDFTYNRQARKAWAKFVHDQYPVGGDQALHAAWPDFPIVNSTPVDSWTTPALPEHPKTGHVSPVDAARRADHDRHRQELQTKWAKQVSTSIRSQCTDMPITVGASSLHKSQAAWAPYLSYYSIHLYPKVEWNTTALIAKAYRSAWAQLPDDSLPAFLEEFAPLQLSPAVSMREYMTVVNETAPPRVRGFTTYMCGLPGGGANCSWILKPNWGVEWAGLVAEFSRSR